MKTLLVEPSFTYRRIYEQALEGVGCGSIAAVGTIAEAEALLSEPYDLVLIEGRLPDGDGLHLVRRIRSGSSGAPPPILVVSANGTRSRVIEAKEAGVAAYLLKPFEKATLEEQISLLCSRREGENSDSTSGSVADA